MLRAAVLDMNNNEPNQSIGMIKAILNRYSEYVQFDIFDVRHKYEVPRMEYNIYIFSGGPGHPIEDGGVWWDGYFDLIQQLWKHNQQPYTPKKHVFFICHSFQMACHHFGIGTISARELMSFGTYPIYKTGHGRIEPFFKGLPEPFYIADFRKYQVLSPDKAQLRKLGAEILAFETLPPGEKRERAIMAIRFSPEMIGTQFHPEANPEGMRYHFNQEMRKKQVVDLYGESRYKHMMHDLDDPKKLKATFATILPGFVENAIKSLNTASFSY